MFDPAYKCLPKAEHYDHHECVLIWKMPPLQNVLAVYRTRFYLILWISLPFAQKISTFFKTV
jgi:hypothetical protein